MWEGRFKSHLVDTSRYFLACCRYIEMNPVRAGIVTRPGDYTWSSYRYHALGVADPLLSAHAEYAALAHTPPDRQRMYRGLFTSDVVADLIDDVRNSVNRGRPLGGDDFASRIERVLDRRIRPAKRGRPAKIARRD
jgi:putative transposase